jgi:hypothetical protein
VNTGHTFGWGRAKYTVFELEEDRFHANPVEPDVHATMIKDEFTGTEAAPRKLDFTRTPSSRELKKNKGKCKGNTT